MIHFALVHFPIALLVTGALLQLMGRFLRREAIQTSAVITSMAGAFFSIPTVAAGFWLAASHATHHPETLEIHRLFGVSTMIVALLGVVVYLLRDRLSKAEPIRNILFLAAAGLALVTGSLGGKMTHGQEHESTNEHRVSDESKRLGQDPENLLHRRIEPPSIGNHSESHEFDGPDETTTKAPIHGSDGHGHEHNHEH